MPSRHLPPLNFEVPVSANAARQDKIEIAVHEGSISDEAGDVANFLHYLGSPPADLEFDAAAFGRIYSRPRRGVPPFPEQTIRKRITENQPHPPPLISGELKIRNPSDQNPGWTFLNLLSLNPTRFIRHQQFPRPASRLLRENPRFAYDFYHSVITPNVFDEFALIESDNWIPDDRLWSLFASPRFWPQHLRSYITGAITEIQADIQRAAEHANVRLTRTAVNPFSLYSLETYWEFVADDPIGVVLALQPMLEGFAATPVNALDYRAHVRLERIENSRRLSLQTRVGETLKIYAKTNRRIRFEVTHQLSGNRPFRFARGGHTFATIEGALPLMESLATVAAERVNEVLNHFRLHSSASDGQHSVLAFIGAVQSATRDPEIARELLQILATNGSLVVGSGITLGNVFRDALRRLVRSGILRTSNRRYSVTPAYRDALSDMQERGIGFLLGARRRRRTR